jgi:hypothetical protein
MSDKKSDDHLFRIPEGGDVFNEEKDRLAPRSSAHPFSHRHQQHNAGVANPLAKISNNPGLSVLAYCLASISMTVVNKYVVSGSAWNLNFLYLAIQVNLLFQNPPSLVCVFPNPSSSRLYAQEQLCSASKLVWLRTWPRSIRTRQSDVSLGNQDIC